jgi:hypothetical protein
LFVVLSEITDDRTEGLDHILRRRADKRQAKGDPNISRLPFLASCFPIRRFTSYTVGRDYSSVYRESSIWRFASPTPPTRVNKAGLSLFAGIHYERTIQRQCAYCIAAIDAYQIALPGICSNASS